MRAIGSGQTAALIAALLAGCGGTSDVKVDPQSCTASTGIFGKVVDRKSDEPLWFVRVSTIPPTDDVRTDENGCFLITEDRSKRPPELQDGRYVVVIDPPPGEVKTLRAGAPVAEVYAQLRTGEFDFKSEAFPVGTLAVERISDGEGGEVIFTPSNLGQTGRTVDE